VCVLCVKRGKERGRADCQLPLVCARDLPLIELVQMARRRQPQDHSTH